MWLLSSRRFRICGLAKTCEFVRISFSEVAGWQRTGFFSHPDISVVSTVADVRWGRSCH